MPDKYGISVTDRAFQAGQSARKRERPRHANPHNCATSSQSDKYWAWFRGWDFEDHAEKEHDAKS